MKRYKGEVWSKDRTAFLGEIPYCIEIDGNNVSIVPNSGTTMSETRDNDALNFITEVVRQLKTRDEAWVQFAMSDTQARFYEDV